VAIVLLPAVLAAEAGGQKRFELDAATVGGVDARGGRLLDEPLQADSEVRVVGAVAGGSACAAA
jgi:hypothetical protein